MNHDDQTYSKTTWWLEGYRAYMAGVLNINDNPHKGHKLRSEFNEWHNGFEAAQKEVEGD